eukprot:scaffold176178_cov64-Cyclotella_meneghiniana.AAC.2
MMSSSGIVPRQGQQRRRCGSFTVFADLTVGKISESKFFLENLKIPVDRIFVNHWFTRRPPIRSATAVERRPPQFRQLTKFFKGSRYS